jgi:NAD(P)-dependent dehydrogenase (short-subunit alcohol dehydrogenase family)
MTRSPWAAKPSASLLVICDFLTVFLASPDADFITGQTIDIDGGKSMLQWHREWPTA